MKHLLPFAGIFALLMSSIQLSSQTNAKKMLDDRSEVEKWIRETRVPALGIGIIREGQLREIRMYGELTPGKPAPFNTIFNVASLTKPIVSMLALKLASSGSLDLDEPLYKYWIDPDIANDPRHQKLTTRLILSHQTGFKNWRYLNNPQKLRFEHEPGINFGYSGEGFEYLRKALENKYKKPLARLADSIIFSPLGMQDTRFGWDASIDEQRFALWHDTAAKNVYKEHKEKTVNAADDLSTTIEDYAKFMVDVLNKRGLDTSICNQMIRPHVATNKGLSMGLGWEIFSELGAKKEYALTHSGSDRGVRALAILLPVSNQGLLIFTNGDNGVKLYERVIGELLSVGREVFERAK